MYLCEHCITGQTLPYYVSIMLIILHSTARANEKKSIASQKAIVPLNLYLPSGKTISCTKALHLSKRIMVGFSILLIQAIVGCIIWCSNMVVIFALKPLPSKLVVLFVFTVLSVLVKNKATQMLFVNL